ncbi:MinD/ParA family ATP-binding protein [Rhodococcus erythropolis]|uniref:MinD/ParA family ATP-binding protein n=1 Tax=Rhodococcus erythropolis TaxID=1833 RepID=UPI001BE78481|nr:MinD/ParA family protein [Rhodococcus erythropolis]MBT2269643.1 AAA family ATPase [Rhodococcus erythropolis]
MSSEQSNRNPELPPWLDASADVGENALDSGGHQVHSEGHVARHAPPPHERPAQADETPAAQPHTPSAPAHAIESAPPAADGGWQPVAPHGAAQAEAQQGASDPFPHVRSTQPEQETEPRSPSPTRHIDSTLNQEAPVVHPRPVPPGSSRITDVRVVSPSNLPPASAQPAPPTTSSSAPNAAVESAPSWDPPTTAFPAQGAGVDTQGSRGTGGYNASVPQTGEPRSHAAQYQQPSSAGQTQPHSTAQPAAPAVGQYGQQHYNGAPPQGPAIQPRQVNPGIASDFRSSTPPRRTIDDLDIIRRAKRPPAKGFRRFLFKLTGGKVNPGQSQAELEYLELVKRINQPSRGVYKIAFVSLKGGVGKTTAAKTVGSTFASLRGDRVIAIDANPDAGTLADREHREHRYTVRDLLADHHIRTYSDVRHYTSQGDSRLEILANETDPATSEAFNEQDYLDALKTLEVHYNIIITDCGTGMMHSAMKGILDEADAVVVVSPTAQDGARSAVSTLAWLNEQGHQRLVEKAVVVVNSTRPGSSSLDLSQLGDVFRQQGVRAVRIIPFDEHLGEGGPIDLPLLSKKTERAYLELAADLADDFVNKGPA